MKDPAEKLYRFCPNCSAVLTRKPIESKLRPYCNDCGFIFWSNPRPVASAILVNDGKVLLVQRAHDPLKGYWCLPGGVIDYEELPEDAVAREVKEETNLDIVIRRLLGVYRIDNDPRGIALDLIYVCHGLKGLHPVILGDEHSDYQFSPVEDLPGDIAYKHIIALKDYINSTI
jgi:8-oxo-dGTP diphosphatase